MIRPEPTGSRLVTWAEFVEAALLKSYRREHDVPLRELRDFINRLRDQFQVPYPLADRRPFVGSGRKLMIDLQDRSHLDPDSPVRIDPLMRFDRPAVGGISTEAIAGELDAGASVEEVAEDFGLDLEAVRWAHSYELAQQAA